MRHREFLRRFRRREGGQAIVEFAVILPVFLLMVLGMIDLARAWNAKQVITDAAREGARWGVVREPPVDAAFINGVIADALNAAGFDASQATITLTPADAAGARGTVFSVNVQYPYTFEFMGIFMSLVGGNTIQLESQIAMREE